MTLLRTGLPSALPKRNPLTALLPLSLALCVPAAHAATPAPVTIVKSTTPITSPSFDATPLDGATPDGLPGYTTIFAEDNPVIIYGQGDPVGIPCKFFSGYTDLYGGIIYQSVLNFVLTCPQPCGWSVQGFHANGVEFFETGILYSTFTTHWNYAVGLPLFFPTDTIYLYVNAPQGAPVTCTTFELDEG